MVTHLGGGHGVAYWQKFSQASSNQTEFYAQIYTHFLIAHESPNLVPKMEALARNSPALYQSYLTVLPSCPLDLINGNLYQDRGGERLSLVFADNFNNIFQTGLNQLHSKIERDEPLETTFFQKQFTRDAPRRLMVGDSIVSWEMLERVKRAKDG